MLHAQKHVSERSKEESDLDEPLVNFWTVSIPMDPCDKTIYGNRFENEGYTMRICAFSQKEENGAQKANRKESPIGMR
jgi:hypothetical protein